MYVKIGDCINFERLTYICYTLFILNIRGDCLRFYKKHESGFNLFLCWFLPALMLLLYYIMRGVYPFGNSTILTGDLGRQYIDFFKYYKETLLNDPSAFTYSFEKSLGGEMIGTWSYYLMSPFNLILLLFPERLFSVGIWLMVLLKGSLSSLSFGYLLTKKYKETNIGVVSFSISYALMSFVTANMLNIIWLDALIWLPLIVLGIDRIINDKKPLLYIISLAIMLVSNYYIGYMLCIFAVMYFLYVSYIKDYKGYVLKYKLKEFGKSFSIFSVASLLSAGLGSFILLPAFYTLLGSKIGLEPIELVFKFAYNPLDIVSRFLLGAFDLENIAAGYPNIFVGTVAFISYLSFYFNRSISKKSKQGVLVLTLLMLLSMNVEALDLAWHAFQEPNWYPYRYAFIFSFMLCLFGYESYLKKDKYELKEVMWYPIIYVLFAFYTFMFINDVNLIEKFLIGLDVFLSLLVVTFMNLERNHRKSLVLLGIVIIEIFLNTFVNLMYFSYMKSSTYLGYDAALEETMGWFNKNVDEDEFYRLEKTFTRSRDDSLSFDFKGISHFNSTIEKNSVNFFSDLGAFASGVVLDYHGGTLITDSFFGLDYYIDLKEENSLDNTKNAITKLPREDIKSYELVGETDEMYIYKNPNALSIGFGVNSEYLSEDYTNKQYMELNNSLISAIANDDIAAFKKETYAITNEDKEVVTELTYTAEDEESLYFNIGKETDVNKSYYVYMPYYVDGKFKTYYTNETETPIYSVEEGESSYTVKNVGGNSDYELEFLVGGTMQLRPELYTLDNSLVSYAKESISGNELVVDSYDNKTVIGHTELTFNRDVLLFTIPYSEGWKVFVDGKEVATKEYYNAFLGVELEAGEHEIELHYEQPYLNLSFAISGLSLAALLGILAVSKKKNK